MEAERLFDVPSFIAFYYSHKIYEYVERDLFPVFQSKFKLPNEERWQKFVLEHMPGFKASSKKPEERKIPFDVSAEPFPKLLSESLQILYKLPIDEFSKLDTSFAPNQIACFADAYNIKQDMQRLTLNHRIITLRDTIINSAKNHEHGVEILNKLLFVVFSFFMETRYNGITRTLLKLFHDYLRPTILEVMNMKESS
jgi:hypothetical protein